MRKRRRPLILASLDGLPVVQSCSPGAEKVASRDFTQRSIDQVPSVGKDSEVVTVQKGTTLANGNKICASINLARTNLVRALWHFLIGSFYTTNETNCIDWIE